LHHHHATRRPFDGDEEETTEQPPEGPRLSGEERPARAAAQASTKEDRSATASCRLRPQRKKIETAGPPYAEANALHKVQFLRAAKVFNQANKRRLTVPPLPHGGKG